MGWELSIFRAAKDATTCGDVWFHPGQLANYQVAVCIQVAVARHLCDTCLATHAKLSMWLCKLYIRRNVRKTISGESKVTQRSENNPLNTAKTKHSVVLQVYKWKRCRFKSLNLGSGRSTKRMASETRFFQFVGLGNLKISGRFRATSPTWSSWHSLPGRKLQEPRSTRKINRSSESSEFLPSSFSEFLPKVDQLGPSQRNSTNLTPRLASLLAILPWTRHLCRPCPGQGTFAVLVILLQIVNHYLRRTVPASLSLVKARTHEIEPCAVIIWLAWTFSKCFINSSCVVPWCCSL